MATHVSVGYCRSLASSFMPVLKPWRRIARLLCDEDKGEEEGEGGGEEEEEEEEEGEHGGDWEGNCALCCYK